MLLKSIPSCCIPPCTHKRDFCLLISPKGFPFLLKIHINRIICAEVGSNDYGSISQTSSMVKYLIYFFIAFMKYSRSSSLISSPKWRFSFLGSFCCKNPWVRKVNGYVIRVATYQIHVVHCCLKNGYIYQFIFDGFYWTWPWSF